MHFSAARTDVFGYAHEGEGGNNTNQVLARMNGISPSGAYFLLVGTNDRAPPLHTVSNILIIAQLLKEKAATGNGVKVFISTLLPRVDQFKERNVKVNVFCAKASGRVRQVVRKLNWSIWSPVFCLTKPGRPLFLRMGCI